jgi:hypothetical protein
MGEIVDLTDQPAKTEGATLIYGIRVFKILQ